MVYCNVEERSLSPEEIGTATSGVMVHLVSLTRAHTLDGVRAVVDGSVITVDPFPHDVPLEPMPRPDVDVPAEKGL